MKVVKNLCVRIRQRYLLVLMCMTGLMLATLNRLSFSFLMNNLIYKNRERHREVDCPPVLFARNRSSGYEEFAWGKDLQLNMNAAWTVGYMMGRLPTGLLTNKLGAKTLYGYSVFITGICALLTPLCARSSPYVILANRVLNGIFSSALLPCIAWFATHWFPGKEMGFMLNLSLAGLPLGCMAMFSLTHEIYHVYGKWVSIYYVLGVITTLWAYVWQAYFWDDPFSHPYISRAELEFLADEIHMYAHDTELEPGWKWPWKSILTSGPLYALSLADLGYTWLTNFATVAVPTLYFPDVHNYEFIEHESIGEFVYAGMVLTTLAAGVIRDTLVTNRWFNVTNVVKTFLAISCVLSSVFLLLLTHVGCNLTTVFLCYIAAIMCVGIGHGMWMDACVNIAPNFAPTNIAISGTVGNIGLPLQVLALGKLSVNKSLEDWKLLSYLNAVLVIFPVALFLKFGKCNHQHWNQPKPRRRTDVVYKLREENKPKNIRINANAGDATELKQRETGVLIQETRPQHDKPQVGHETAVKE